MGVDPASIALIISAAGAVIGAGGAVVAGHEQKEAADAQADQANADAQAAAGAAQVQAQKIRDATKQRQSQAIAAQAAAGVDVGSGTAEQIVQNIGDKGEQDALTTILNGSNQAARTNASADALRISGENAETAGDISAGSTLLGAAGSIGSKWRGVNTNGIVQGSNSSGYNGTMNNPSAYVGG